MDELGMTPLPDMAGILARYRASLAPGSVVVISHASADMDDPAVAARVRETAELYRHSATPVVLRDRPGIRALLGRSELVPPGLVELVDWPAPGSDSPSIAGYVAVGRW